MYNIDQPIYDAAVANITGPSYKSALENYVEVNGYVDKTEADTDEVMALIIDLYDNYSDTEASAVMLAFPSAARKRPIKA